ncbi:MAG: 4-(cytidine 5'-diphospho)-2-C-methyl-D-erythritol kinase [Pirellulaceae bacterium]|nr:4-(cytidine 5'-diphospho)-2-C-methyl-D-erythritol kinase [Pirellulaceae bacterium]
MSIRTPAKLNLFLEVLAKRADGYHEIDTVMCPVSLLDQLHFEPGPGDQIDFTIHCPSAPAADPAWQIPADETNLVVKAWRSVALALGQPAGCRIVLDKQIPAAAGLGGGSADAAAAIVAALVAHDRWDRTLATQIASRLGSDIPLFLGDHQSGIGLARATGRGEHVEILSGRPPLCFVISHPPVGSSTAEVYKLWRLGHRIRSSKDVLALCNDGSNHPTSDLAASSCPEQLYNALQSPASQLTDWIARQLEAFARLGKPKAIMSGSGSACFAIVNNLDEGHVIAKNMIELGLPRAYVATAWYAAPIEQQLERIT